MIIAHVVESLDYGGAESLVESLCRIQGRQGHSVSVHCLFGGGPLAGRLAADGFPVYIHGPAPLWRIALGLNRYFRRNVPHAVHCHNRMAALVAAPLARWAGAGTVLCTRHGLVSSNYSKLLEFLFWLAARACDRVVAVCDAAGANLGRWLGSVPEKIVTIRNGCDPAPSASHGEILPKHGFQLVHVARLTWKKDQSTLLHAVSLAARRVPDLGLWIIGDGPDRSALESLAERLNLAGRVHFLGYRADVGRWLAAADLFVLSSLTEGTPVSLLEAMAAGLPFVVTDAGGMSEVVRVAGVGETVPKGQPEALAEAIVRHATRRDSLPFLKEQALLAYRRFFTTQAMADQYMELYQHFSQRRSGKLPTPAPNQPEAQEAAAVGLGNHRRTRSNS